MYFLHSRSVRTAVVTVCLIFIPASTHAASISLTIDSALSSPNRTAVSVYLNPESARANVVEGTIGIPQSITGVTISTGDSSVLLWPNPPQFILADHTVTFTGGTPDVFPEAIPSKLFTMYLATPMSDTYPFTFRNGAIYLADGKGTKKTIPSNTENIYVSESTTTQIEGLSDRVPPQFFAELGKNPDLFEGQWYVTFYGKDAGTGIMGYEVKEGWFGAYRPAQQYYVLRDQTLRAPVWVRATDGAGNHADLLVDGTNQSLLLPILGTLLFICIVGFGYYVWRRRNYSLHG